MIVFTDTQLFSEALLGQDLDWCAPKAFAKADPYESLLRKLLPGHVFQTEIAFPGTWKYCFLAEWAAESQFDVLAELGSAGETMTGEVLCCAESGNGFHGQQGRDWVSCRGNLHLSALFRPHQRLPNCGIGFIVLGVVSVLQTLDALGCAGAEVKWVNDIMMEDCKVGGILAHVKTRGEYVTSALVGIGLNVETRPEVRPTSFVREVAAINDLVSAKHKTTVDKVFRELAQALSGNYEKLLSGDLPAFLKFYRERSSVLGKQVSVFEDENEATNKIAFGRVRAIGDNLELLLDGGQASVWRGRLIID